MIMNAVSSSSSSSSTSSSPPMNITQSKKVDERISYVAKPTTTAVSTIKETLIEENKDAKVSTDVDRKVKP